MGTPRHLSSAPPAPATHPTDERPPVPPGTVDPVSTTYRILVMAHLLCVVGGFGALAYNGLFLTLARRRGNPGMAAIEINAQVSGFAEFLVYGVFLFGIAAVATSSSKWGFGQAWVSAAFALFIVAVGVLHGMIRPSQRRFVSLATSLAEMPAPSAARSGALPAGGPRDGTPGNTGGGPADRSADVAQLNGLERRISLGWGLFNLIVVVVIYLMVFKPGA